MSFRFLTAGESHGKKLSAIIDGIPANFDIDINMINNELARRQQGYGRGARMKIENDTAEITSGIRFGKTIGSPIAIEIPNLDFENWKAAMSTIPKDNIDRKLITKLRPGHADFAGVLKYNQDDVRNILERASARETAIKVAIGSIAKQVLQKFEIEISSSVISIGQVVVKEIDDTCRNDLNCKNPESYELMKAEIDNASAEGVTLGGQIKLTIKGLPVGLGSHTNWDKKFDACLAKSLMSIQAIKSVEIGLGKEVAFLTGDKVHDEIFNINGTIQRKTNNAGGIEGGMTNGEDVVTTIAMKPIPTMKKALKSVDISDKTEQDAHFERSDTCAITACGVIAEAMSAITVLEIFLEKFGGDSFEEISANYTNYISMIAKRI